MQCSPRSTLRTPCGGPKGDGSLPDKGRAAGTRPRTASPALAELLERRSKCLQSHFYRGAAATQQRQWCVSIPARISALLRRGRRARERERGREGENATQRGSPPGTATLRPRLSSSSPLPFLCALKQSRLFPWDSFHDPYCGEAAAPERKQRARRLKKEKKKKTWATGNGDADETSELFSSSCLFALFSPQG